MKAPHGNMRGFFYVSTVDTRARDPGGNSRIFWLRSASLSARTRDTWWLEEPRFPLLRQRALKIRPAIIRGVVVGVLIVTAGGVAFLLWLPSGVSAGLAAFAEQRAGLQLTVGAVSVGLGEVELQDLRLASPAGPGVEIAITRTRVRAGLWGVLLHGVRGVQSVDASQVRAEIDVSSAAFQALRTKLAAGAPKAQRAGPAGQLVLHAGDISVRVRAGRRLLVSADGVDAQSDAQGARVEVKQAQLGDKGVGSVSGVLHGLHLLAERGSRLQLRRFVVDDAAFELGPKADDGSDTKAVAATGSPQVPVAVPGTPAPASNGSSTALSSLMARLAQGAQLELKHVDVQTRSPAGLSPLLRAVHVEIRQRDERQLQLMVQGAAHGGGKIDADLRVWPTELRADGNVALSSLPLGLIAPLLPSVPWYEPEHSTLDAELTMHTESDKRIALSGRAALRDAALFSPKLAADVVGDINFSLQGSGSFFPSQRRLEIDEGHLQLGKSKVDLHGAVELAADHYTFDLSADLPRTPCTDAVRSIPNDLLGDLALAQWTGWLAGHVVFQADSRQLDKTVLKLDVTDRCEFTSVPAMADLRRFQQPFTQSVEEPDGTIFQMETGPGTEAWTGIDAISPFLIYAVLAHEDPQFFNHHGFSPAHIRDALVRNLREGRYVLGASTITMQLVKNVFLRREKTLARKIQEVLLTWWIERVFPKRDGLELYLNVIEYGPSVYGIRNAAKHYFNRLPSELSPAESVFLATILPNPKRYHSFFERGALSAGWVGQMRTMLQRLRARGFYTKEAADYGLGELEHFTFTPEGTPAPPRAIPGGTAPLPYVVGAPAPHADEHDDSMDSREPAADGYD